MQRLALNCRLVVALRKAVAVDAVIMVTVKAVATIRKVQNLAEIILSKRIAPVTKTVINAPVTRMVRNLAAANTRIVQSPAVTTMLQHRNNLSFV